jgi:hypothetical protein
VAMMTVYVRNVAMEHVQIVVVIVIVVLV